MLGASALEIWKERHALAGGAGVSVLSIAIGCVVAFVVALVVVRWFVGLVGKRGFAPFAWYRIVAGSAALIWLMGR
jgi:undecaprenyl-diphosphatase